MNPYRRSLATSELIKTENENYFSNRNMADHSLRVRRLMRRPIGLSEFLLLEDLS